MKTNTTFGIINILFLTILMFFVCETSSQSVITAWEYNSTQNDDKQKVTKQKKLPQKAAKYFKGMQLIFGGSFIMGNIEYTLHNTKTDSTLLVNNTARRVTVSSFYICDHEVTNAEYKEFASWVRDSIARKLLADNGFDDYRNNNTKKINWNSEDESYSQALTPLYISEKERFYRKKDFDNSKLIYSSNTLNNDYKPIGIYPDTLVWIAGILKYSYNEPLSKSYFWHPSYNDYPVVGVSWEQANAYCNWRTNQLNQAILKSKKDINLYPKFRLPTEAEWEYAALSTVNEKTNDESKIYQREIFPWNHSRLTDKKGNYLANFGSVIDRNGFCVKPFDEKIIDKKTQRPKYLYTSPVKSFRPNNFKLYDMGGNVAEWVIDVACITSWEIHEFNPFRGNVFRISPEKEYHKDSLGNIRVNYRNSNDKEYNESDKVSLRVNANDDIRTAVNKIIKRRSFNDNAAPDITKKHVKEALIYQAEKEIHDAKIIAKNKNGRIVKGGSWMTGPAYMQCACREVFSQNRSSCTIGFRVAMTVVENVGGN